MQDLFDRSIVAWVYSKQQDIRLGLATLQLLSFRGLAAGAMLLSYRGSICTAQHFREAPRRMGLKQRFSRTANRHDNATMECFNGAFKVESLYNPLLMHDRAGFKEQSALIGRYIEFHNNRRPHSALGNQTPTEHRQHYFNAALNDWPQYRAIREFEFL